MAVQQLSLAQRQQLALQQRLENEGFKAEALRQAVIKGDIDSVHAFYQEVKRIVGAIDTGVGLRIRPAAVTIAVAINTGTSGGSASDDFRVPEDEDFVIEEIRGHLSFNNWDGETLTITGLGQPTPTDRIAIKAYNARILLENIDSKRKLFDENDISLGDILAASGGQPIRGGSGLRPAFVIAHGQTLRMTATLRDTASALVGGESNYGVTLVGVFLSRATRRAE